MYGYCDVKYELQNEFYSDIYNIFGYRIVEQKVFVIFNVSLIIYIEMEKVTKKITNSWLLNFSKYRICLNRINVLRRDISITGQVKQFL